MAQPGNEETVRAWADITLKIWREKITEMKVWDTGALYESLKYTLFMSAGNSVEKIEFAFNFYGMFVDLGSGRWGERTPKKWYSTVYYREVMRLKEILVEKFGQDAARQVVSSIKKI